MEMVVTTAAVRQAKLQLNRQHQQTNTQLFTGRMPFQQQSTEGNARYIITKEKSECITTHDGLPLQPNGNSICLDSRRTGFESWFVYLSNFYVIRLTSWAGTEFACVLFKTATGNNCKFKSTLRFVTVSCAGQMGWPAMPRTLVSRMPPTHAARSHSVDRTEAVH